MHHKTIVADGHFGMIGGRNMGDRYFGVYDVFVQNDLDIMAVGPVVPELEASFDLYWNSPQSYPITAVIRHARRYRPLEQFTQMLQEEYLAGADKLAMYPLQRTDWRAFFQRLEETYLAADWQLSYDLPELENDKRRRLYADFKAFLAKATERVLISTAYLIPDPELMALLASLEQRGVEIVVLTNSMASNNHLIANAGYRQWRKELLEIGVELHELRVDAQSLRLYSLPPTEAGSLGLHTKAAVVDDRWSFIGSPNVDPRSMLHNTEIGLFLDSEALNSALAALLIRDLAPENSWRVWLNERGKLRWTNSDETVKLQPAMGFKQRFIEFLMYLVPGAKGQA
jgi:putative cardiolipin synthase